jgi:very-short-patch-repair endonuclease
MKLKGWTVVRIWAWDVMRDLEGAVGTIEGVIEELTDEAPFVEGG